MIRRTLGLAGLILLLGVVVGSATAAAPAGPRLAFVRLGDQSQGLDLLSVDPAGVREELIVGGDEDRGPIPLPIAPAWSPDGSLLAFTGLTAGRKIRIFVVAADGTGLRPVAGTRNGFSPVFGPDGTLAFSRVRQRGGSSRAVSRPPSTPRYASASVWTVDVEGGSLRRLTPLRNGLENYPSSFSPDGSTLAISRSKGRRTSPEAVALHLDGSGSTVIAREAAEPVYSPDGSEIALLRVRQRAYKRSPVGGTAVEGVETTSDLYVMAAEGGGLRRLTDTPGKLEVEPSWDPSGERLAYAQFQGGSRTDFLGFGNAIMEINADGSCRTKVLTSLQAAFYGPAWQTGTGREAGRIECLAGH